MEEILQNNTQAGGEKKNTTPEARGAGNARTPRGGGDRDARRSRRVRRPRVRSEYDNKILGIRRVTRVVAGGRRFSFSVTMVIGNGRGEVGVGLGKASDTALAIEKATRDAKKHLIKVLLTEDFSIPHEVQAKSDAAEILLIPAPGKGFKAGSAVRTVLELAGVKHVSAKILTRSKNPLNNARATILALKKLTPIAHKMRKASQRPQKDRGREKKSEVQKTQEVKSSDIKTVK